jgi:hypothetical protein
LKWALGERIEGRRQRNKQNQQSANASEQRTNCAVSGVVDKRYHQCPFRYFSGMGQDVDQTMNAISTPSCAENKYTALQ